MLEAELLKAVQDGTPWAFLEVSQSCHPTAGVRLSMGGLDSTRKLWVLRCNDCGACVGHIVPCPAPENVRWKQTVIIDQMIMESDGTIRRVGRKRLVHGSRERDAES